MIIKNHSGKIVFGLIGSLMFILILFFGFDIKELNGEKTDCYDGFRNKIEGQTCIVENFFNSQVAANFFGIIIGGIMFFFIFMIGFIIDAII